MGAPLLLALVPAPVGLQITALDVPLPRPEVETVGFFGIAPWIAVLGLERGGHAEGEGKQQAVTHERLRMGFGVDSTDAYARAGPRFRPPDRSGSHPGTPNKDAPATVSDDGRAVARNKPSSVPLRGWIIYLGRTLPTVSSRLPGTQWSGATPRSCSALLRVGFAARPLLPEARCALTAPFHPYLCARRRHRRSALCGTFRHRPKPAPGRYPAPCPAKLGLSSDGAIGPPAIHTSCTEKLAAKAVGHKETRG